MPKLAGYTEILRIGELRAGEHLGKYLKRAALMGQHCGGSGVTTKGCYLHREGADIHADVRHARPSWNRS